METEEDNAAKPENGENKSEDAKSAPSLQFSHVECALFALHALCKKAPEALGADAARLKALRLRLQYTARLTQGYIKKLKEVTQVANTFNFFLITTFRGFLSTFFVHPPSFFRVCCIQCPYAVTKLVLIFVSE